MEGEYLFGLVAFYTIVWVIAIVLCIYVRDGEAFITGVFLGAIYYANSSLYFWFYPENMAIYHLFVVVFMCMVLDGKRGFAILAITYLMFLSDIFWVLVPELPIEPMAWNFPHDYFYWQSILNLSLFAMCIITISGCLKTLKIDRLRKRLKEMEGDDTFEASEGTHALDAHPGS